MVSELITSFFARMEAAGHEYDGEYIAAQFNDTFMAANPDGKVQVATRENMRTITSKRQEFFNSVGLQSVKFEVLEETPLINGYVMAQVRSHMHFERQAESPIDLEDNATYILYTKVEPPQIVFFLTHGDFMTLMREHGIAPAST